MSRARRRQAPPTCRSGLSPDDLDAVIHREQLASQVLDAMLATWRAKLSPRFTPEDIDDFLHENRDELHRRTLNIVGLRGTQDLYDLSTVEQRLDLLLARIPEKQHSVLGVKYPRRRTQILR